MTDIRASAARAARRISDYLLPSAGHDIFHSLSLCLFDEIVDHLSPVPFTSRIRLSIKSRFLSLPGRCSVISISNASSSSFSICIILTIATETTVDLACRCQNITLYFVRVMFALLQLRLFLRRQSISSSA